MLDPRVSHYLGPLEAEIMAIFWEIAVFSEIKDASVREVSVRLNHSRPDKPLAYTTVMTVTSRLAEKGLLSRRLLGKTYEYRAAFSESEFLERLSNEQVAAVLSEFGDLAVTQFLGHLERLGPEQLHRLVELAEAKHDTEEP